MRCSKCKKPTKKVGYCTDCRKSYNRNYQKNNRALINEKRREYYKYNSKTILAISKKWRDAVSRNKK